MGIRVRANSFTFCQFHRAMTDQMALFVVTA